MPPKKHPAPVGDPDELDRLPIDAKHAAGGPGRFIKRMRRQAKPFGKKLARFFANSSLPAILLAATLLLARYIPNSDFSYPSEIILPITLFAAVASAAFYGYRWSFRGRPGPAHVATFLLVYSLYGFNYAFPYVKKWSEALLPSSLTTAFSSALARVLLLAVIFWVLAWLIDRAIRYTPRLRQLQPYKVLLFAIAFIFVVQAAKVGGRLWEVRHQLAYQPTTSLPTKPSSGTAAAKPNIYYLLFDRYASTETLQNVYGYDNSAMLDFFEQQGFSNRPTAYANYPFTQQSISSTLSMGYLSQLEERFKNDSRQFQTAFPYRSIISDPPVAQTLKQNGYRYNQVSSWWDFTRVGVEADNDPVKSYRLRVLGLDFWLTDLQRDIMHKSAFSPLLQKGLSIGDMVIIKYDQDRNPRQNFEDQLTAVRQIAEDSRQQKQPQFTFAHFLSPHDPYIFAADGSSAPYNGDRTDQDIDEYQKYTNQLTYINTRIQEMVSAIRQNDPQAVIVFQPDEGPYPKDFRGRLSADNYFDPKNLDQTGAKHKFGITASYYMPGQDPEAVGQQLTSSVNVFPYILNTYLGYDIGYLPECNFSAGNKFTIYDFSPQTSRLQGGSEPSDCRRIDR